MSESNEIETIPRRNEKFFDWRENYHEIQIQN